MSPGPAIPQGAARYYDPNQAQFQDFDPFWEFVAGPLNAGTFGPNALDNTFGPQVIFNSIPDGMKPKRPPSDGLQFFGSVRVDGQTDVMTVGLYNLEGSKVYSVDLEPVLTSPPLAFPNRPSRGPRPGAPLRLHPTPS